MGRRENMSVRISPGRDSSSPPPPPPSRSSVIFLFLKLFSEFMNDQRNRNKSLVLRWGERGEEGEEEESILLSNKERNQQKSRKPTLICVSDPLVSREISLWFSIQRHVTSAQNHLIYIYLYVWICIDEKKKKDEWSKVTEKVEKKRERFFFFFWGWINIYLTLLLYIDN